MNGLLRKGDFYSGLSLAALGAYIVMQATRWTYMGEDGPGAGFFPIWYGAAMMVLSLAVVAGAALKSSAAPETQWSDVRRAMLCWTAFTISVALLKIVGFAVAFALLTWFIVAWMYRQPQRTALLLAIGSALLFHGLFVWLLDIPLPPGYLLSALGH